MGMFDTVILESLKLPNLPKDISIFLKNNNGIIKNDFQTKDLDNSLSCYYIKNSGQIFREEYIPTGKKIPYENPFKGWKDNRSFLERLYYKIKNLQIEKKYPSLRKVDERKPVLVKCKYTGSFNIYNIFEINNRYIELEFKIDSVKGIVKKVSILKASLETLKESKQRKLRDSQFDEKLLESKIKRDRFVSRWYYPILKEIYNPIVFFSSIFIRMVCEKMVKLTYRWRSI